MVKGFSIQRGHFFAIAQKLGQLHLVDFERQLQGVFATKPPISFDYNFQNLTFCGSQVGNWGGIWYNWPITQWALRVKYQLASELCAQIGAYEQNPSNTENTNGFKLSGSGTQGAVLPVELVWTPRMDELPVSTARAITTAPPTLVMC